MVRTNLEKTADMEGMDLFQILRELHIEKQRLDRIIRELEGLQGRETPDSPRPVKRRGRKSMSPEERREVSERMKKYWATRRRQ
jgi:hypothetical protein